MEAVRTEALTCRFDPVHGVDGLELRVPMGGIYGFLGPNGAGKTTTIRLLLGLLQPQAGRVWLLEREQRRGTADAREAVGALVEYPSLYAHLSGRDNLEVTRRLLDIPHERVDAALDRVGLLGEAGRKAGVYSLGMRQRLGLALALLNRPRLLILDEPGNGLDPAGTLQMRALIRSLAHDDGITVFLSSHLLAEVEHVATHIGVLHAGRLRYQGSLKDLQGRMCGQVRLQCADRGQLLDCLATLGERGQVDGDDVVVRQPRHDDTELLRALVIAGVPVHGFHRERPTLESLFFGLTDVHGDLV